MSLVNLVYQGILLLSHNRWPREKVFHQSEARFRAMLAYAYSNSSFYREYYRSHGINEKDLPYVTPSDIPPIDKDRLRSHFYSIAPDPPKPNEVERALKGAGLLSRAGKYFLVHSSGSTGEPANFLYSESAITTVEANFIRISLGGENAISPKDFPIRTLYVASVGSGYASTALAFKGLGEYRSKSLILNIQQPLQNWAERIQSFNPNYIAGYPSCVRIIADLQEKGSISIRPKKVITGGEPLTSEDKAYLWQVFGADVIDYYACSESLFLGVGTNWYDGIYLFDDMNYVEVDKHSQLIITPLYNHAFPLIRYRLSDVVLGFTREKTGSLPYTHIDKILGRSEEMMWFKKPDGQWDFLHPLFLDDLNVPGIKQYQFVQTSATSFILRVIPRPGACLEVLNEKAQAQVYSFLSKKKLDQIRFGIEFVDRLEPDRMTGKVKLVENLEIIRPSD
ncbi:MAG: phenylacetate--CoA ligase family protein [Limnochordaceae bacterium]|nr:phenylacetate--CoA ligase family protein [Limnochordaceae bacterium]